MARLRKKGEAEPRSRAWPVLLGLAAFTAHALTAPSGLFWLDAGDFVTASGELGVPHPTGYPLYTLVGKLFTLVPVGSAAFRVSLLSAACAGLVTGLLTDLVVRLAPADRRGFAVVAAAAASAVLWSTDVAALFGRTPEVYGLHAALLLAAVGVWLRLIRRDDPGDWLAFGFVLGLGLSNHAEFRLFAPVLLVFAASAPLSRGRRRLRRLVGRGLLGLGGLLAGLLPYLYLPLAAGRGPYHAWGQPDTLGRFWDHVTGLSIRLGFRDELFNLSGSRLAVELTRFGEQVWSDFGTLLLLVPLGLLWLGRRHRRLALLAITLLVVDVGYAVAINPMGLVDLQNGAPTYALLAAALALGFVALAELVRHHVAPRADRALVAPLVVLGVLVAGLEADPRRIRLIEYWGAEDLVFAGLQEAPEGALVLTGSESFAAGRLYWVGLGALRPDTQALHMSDVTDARTLLARHRRGAFPLAADDEVARWEQSGVGASDETFRRRVDHLVARAFAEGRAVLWGPGAESEAQGRWDRIELGFPLARLRPDPVAPGAPPHGVAEPRFEALSADLWGSRWLAQYWNWVGVHRFRRESLRDSADAWRRAAGLYPSWSAPLVNQAVVAARTGDLTRASELAETAAELDPLNLTAWLNLARYRCALGSREGAGAALARARGLSSEPARVREVAAFVDEACPVEAPH